MLAKTLGSQSFRTASAAFRVLLAASSLAVFSGQAAAETYTIKMGTDRGLLKFQPNKLTVRPGDTIVWELNKLAPHSVVFDPAKVPGQDKALAESLSHKKLLLSPGQKVETRFPDNAPVGTYGFYCAPHRGAGMTGVITVAE